MGRFDRRRTDGEGQRASTLELFYDLVFVFAITQVSHLLLAHLSWEGAGQSALVLLVVWWSWNYTTWVTNELDPQAIPVRLLLIALMLGSLLMAAAIPDAFGGRAALFAGSYVAIQLGRHIFLTFVAAEPGTIERRRASAILVWFVAAGSLWIAGAVAAGPARTALWLAALTVDYAGPATTYWIPGRPRLRQDVWDVGSEHFTERFQLFVIIALGESIVVIGATTSHLSLSGERLFEFGFAFLGTATLWWLYFSLVAAITQRRLALAENRVAMARDAFTYLHVTIVGAIIVFAVGAEIVIAHPGAELSGARLAAVVAGPAAYLFSLVVLRLRMAGTVAGRRVAGGFACIAVAALSGVLPAIAISGLLLAILVGVIVGDELAAARRRARGEASPMEQLEASAGP